MAPEIRVFLNGTNVPGLLEGEPALFALPSMKLLEEPTFFLKERYVRSGRRSSPRTWSSAAYALSSWLDFLNEINVSNWREASRDDLIGYRESYMSAISPKTGAAYATGTVALRMSVICAFYDFAFRRDWYVGDIAQESPQGSARNIPIDMDALEHIRKGVRPISSSGDLIPKRRPGKTSIRPFLPKELTALLAELGPRASEKHGDQRPARDRLIVDLGWAVGLRLDEIAKLTKYQFLVLVPSADAPVAEQALTVTGKGKVARTVAVPNWLVIDVVTYIDGERACATSNGLLTGRKEPAALLVSSRDSRKPGAPISRRRIQQIVELACIRAALVQTKQKVDPEACNVQTVIKARHCTHDLRHTYAVFTYWAEKRAGNSEPWKKIQAQLGHAHLQTTIDTYLRFVEIFGEREGVVDLRRLLVL